MLKGSINKINSPQMSKAVKRNVATNMKATLTKKLVRNIESVEEHQLQK
jgi:hypothetical protein